MYIFSPQVEFIKNIKFNKGFAKIKLYQIRVVFDKLFKVKHNLFIRYTTLLVLHIIQCFITQPYIIQP